MKRYVIEVLVDGKLVTHPSLPTYTDKAEAERASAMVVGASQVVQIGNCTGYIEGSPYSRRGAGRFDRCQALPKYTVRRENFTERHVCGVHVRNYRAMNKAFERSGRALGETRPPYYDITPYAEDSAQ